MGTHKGRKKNAPQGNPKLRRPDYLSRPAGAGSHGAASFRDGVPGMDDQTAVPFPPASTSQDAFLDGVLGMLKSTVDLNGLELEEEQDKEQGTGMEQGAPAKTTFLDHLPRIKRFDRAHHAETEKAAAEDFGQFVVSSFAKDKATRAELRKIMLQTRHAYEKDLGGRANLVQGERDYIDTICFLCLVEHLISMASVRRGVVKENRSTGKVQSQPILEKLMGAVLNQKRLYIASLYSLHKLVSNGFGNGRRPAAEDDAALQGRFPDPLDNLNDLQLILTGKAKTEEQWLADYRAIRDAESRGDAAAITRIVGQVEGE
jgi:hypothetical protein